jgi:hypothetical protein
MKTVINVLYFTFLGLTTRYEIPRTEVPTSPSEFVNRYQLPEEIRLLVLRDGVEVFARYEDFPPQADTILQVSCVSFEQAMRTIRFRAAHQGVPKQMTDCRGVSYRAKSIAASVATIERTAPQGYPLELSPEFQIPIMEVRRGLYWGTFIEVP